MGVIDAFVAGDFRLGAGVFFAVPFDDGSAGPFAGGGGIEPVEGIVAEVAGVVDEEGFVGFMLAVHVVEDEVELDVGAVGVGAEVGDGFLGVGPPLVSFFSFMIHEADVGVKIPTVLLVGVDGGIGVRVKEDALAIDLLVVVLEIGEGIVGVGEVAGGEAAFVEAVGGKVAGHLGFAGPVGLVTAFLGDVADEHFGGRVVEGPLGGFALFVEVGADVFVMPPFVEVGPATGHHHGATRGADDGGPGGSDPATFRGELVEDGGLGAEFRVGGIAAGGWRPNVGVVEGKLAGGDVVGVDEDDVGLLGVCSPPLAIVGRSSEQWA